MHRRDLLLGGTALAATLATRRALGACAGIGTKSGIGADYSGGLETRSGVNVGYFPYRVQSASGGTWLWSGDANGVGRRLAWIPNGVEIGLTSGRNLGSCVNRSGHTGNCASDAPPPRPGAHGSQWHWGYAERFPNASLVASGASIAACTSDQGWLDVNDLVFTGLGPHTVKKGPAGRDFEVFHASCGAHETIASHALPNARWGANVSCNAVNACDEGADDCRSDDGNAVNYGENSAKRSTCLGGYEFSAKVSGARACGSPDLVDGTDLPVSYLFYAPRSNTKCYLHKGDVVKVMYRKTIDIGHASGPATKSTWYGIEVLQSGCPVLTPVGVRGWVMAFSEWDQQQSGRGLFFTPAR